MKYDEILKKIKNDLQRKRYERLFNELKEMDRQDIENRRSEFKVINGGKNG